MSAIIFLREAVLDNNTAFLVKQGLYSPQVITCEYEKMSETKKGWRCFYNLEKDKHSNSFDLIGKTWIEIMTFYNKPCGRSFKANLVKNDRVEFEIINNVVEKEYFEPIELSLRKNSCFLVLNNGKTTNEQKASTLLEILLDIQMCCDEEENNDSSDWKMFYDEVIKLIKQLSPEIWEANECQVWLPSMND